MLNVFPFMEQVSSITSLYVHVPFCARKCEYCAFYSEASDGATINRYVEALIREMEMVAPELRPRTVFFGGGTPSLLNLGQWEKILLAMQRLGLLGAEEWTVECNPATVSLDKAKLLRSFGVNRISMGVQSLNEDLLDRLGRVHSREMVFKSFDVLRAAGFDNLSIDLMFAIPGQTLEVWRETLTEALALGSEHLSSYEVIYEDDTPLFHQMKAGKCDLNEDLACAMFDELLERTARGGFQQYEIANFARRAGPVTTTAQEEHDARRVVNLQPGTAALRSADVSPGETGDVPFRACQHNVNYWRGGCFHGLGPSASGYVGGARTKNWSNTILYCERLDQGRRAIESSEILPPLARAGEIAAFGLRMNAGWPLAEFKARTGFDLGQEWRLEIQQLLGLGYGMMNSERFHLTTKGLRYADWAAEQFLRPAKTEG